MLAQEAVFQGPYLNFAVSRCVGQEVTISRASELRTALQRRFGLALTLPDDDAPPPDSDLEQALREEYLRATAASDLRRKTTERELLAMIRQNPLLGNGLGAAVPSRESGLDELFYLDTVCRMGVLGLLLYLAPLLALLRDTRKHLRHSSAASAQLTVFCGLAALLIATGFNPWMNAVLGIAWYSLAAALPGIGRDTSPAKNEKEFYT